MMYAFLLRRTKDKFLHHSEISLILLRWSIFYFFLNRDSVDEYRHKFASKRIDPSQSLSEAYLVSYHFRVCGEGKTFVTSPHVQSCVSTFQLWAKSLSSNKFKTNFTKTFAVSRGSLRNVKKLEVITYSNIIKIELIHIKATIFECAGRDLNPG